MSGLTKWAFKNKAAMMLAVVMALVAGIFSYMMLPMEFLPEADNPSVTVTTIGPGYDAKSMETAVTAPLEKAVDLVKGKTDMFSQSGNGFSRIDLMFDSGTDMKEAAREVEQVIGGVSLPERVSTPFVLQLNTSMIPISWVTIGFDEGLPDQRKHQLEERIVGSFRKVDGVGAVQLSGKSSPTVTIEADPAKLAEHQVPYQALMGVLQGRAVSASVGEQTLDGTVGNVKVTANVGDVAALAALPVAQGVALGDVAKVETASGQQSVSRVNGREVMVLSITKAANANAVAVGEAVEAHAEELNGELDGVEVAVMSSTAEQVTHSVNSMLREVLLGALFATIVILLFMRNIRATLVTIVSIPLSLGLTLYLLDVSGVTLNIITLGGVAVAVGRLVDDSIVVIENIYRRLQRENFSVQLVVDATKEVATAITSSTLTTVAVFLPMGLLRGALQDFLLPFALTVTYSLLASLVVALTVVPLLSASLLTNTKMVEHEPSRRFTSFLRWNLNHKWLPLFIALLLFVGSIGGYVMMPKGAIDSSNAEALMVTLEYPSDTPVDRVMAEAEKLETFIAAQPEKKWVYMWAGNSEENAKWGNVSSPTLVSYQLEMKKGEDAEALIDRIHAQKPEFPGAELAAAPLDFMSGTSGSDIYVDVTGEDPASLEQASGQIAAKLAAIDGVLKVKTNQEEKKPVFTFEVNPSKAKAGEVAMQLQGMLNAVPIGTLTTASGETPVMLQPIVKASGKAELERLTIMTEAGPARVSSIARLVETEEPSMYYHKNGQTYIRISASVEPSRLSVVGAEIDKATRAIELPDGVDMLSGGASAQQADDFAQIGATGLVSILIVYLIMVITFRTLRAPLAILFSLPLAAIGAVLGLMATGVTPDFTAAFGALMLVGIVVTNAIVLVDRVKHNEASMPIREAIVEAAGTRMRPILMTAIATICAMLPLVFGTSESGSIVSQSLAIVVIGGLAAATVLTLVIVPCVYELFYFRKSRKQRREAETQRLAA